MGRRSDGRRLRGNPRSLEVDVRTVVLVNHELVLEGISPVEAEEIGKLDLTEEAQRGYAAWIGGQHDAFRKAANNLAGRPRDSISPLADLALVPSFFFLFVIGHRRGHSRISSCGDCFPVPSQFHPCATSARHEGKSSGLSPDINVYFVAGISVRPY
jgi:hypothetical protein